MSIFENLKDFPKKSAFVTDIITIIFFVRFFVTIFFKIIFGHFLSLETLRKRMETLQKSKFYCDKCQYITNNKKDWQRHISTAKHSLSQGVSKFYPILPHFTPDGASSYICEQCSQKYKTRGGLWKHKQKCTTITQTITNNKIEESTIITLNIEEDYNKPIINPNNNETLKLTDITDKQMIIQLLTQNQELQKTIIELTKHGINNYNSNNTINSNNKFNLQFFLNDTCKNAMNIDEFVDSIEPTLQDLENVGRVGYVEGISQIIINKLNNTEVTERPIHCSDLKREIMYIKNEDVWSKEVEGNPILLRAIKEVAHKNMKNILEWAKANPGCTQADSRKNDLYLDIVSNSMCGLDKEESTKNFNKIISKLSKRVALSDCKNGAKFMT